VIHKQIVLGFVVVVFLLAPSAANGNDLSALQARFEADMQAFNSHNADAFVASAHDEIVLFGILSPFPVDGKEEFRQVMQQYLADHESVTLAAINPEFHLSGTTGIAWGHYRLTHKLKDGPLEYSHGRYTFTYTQVEGRWVLVAMHYSPLQSTYFMTF
jgi:ketosteroid isomerase-like protein